MGTSAHLDRFVLDHLPAADQQPDFVFDLPELAYADHANAAAELLRRAIAAAGPDGRALIDFDHEFSWSRVDAISGRMAQVLVEEMGLVPGNRVLLHGPNSAWTVMAWFAILKAGGVVVATMPMLRAAELATVIDKGRISHALVYEAFAEVVNEARAIAPALTRVMDSATLQQAAQALPAGFRFDPVETAADDPALIAFTSGTTGKPKGCVHLHRDILAMTDTFARHVVGLTKDDVVVGTPPIAFTFGLGGLIVFPAAAGAATAFAPGPASTHWPGPSPATGPPPSSPPRPAIAPCSSWSATTTCRACAPASRPARPCPPPPPTPGMTPPASASSTASARPR